jgi:hypothetical protein
VKEFGSANGCNASVRTPGVQLQQQNAVTISCAAALILWSQCFSSLQMSTLPDKATAVITQQPSNTERRSLGSDTSY